MAKGYRPVDRVDQPFLLPPDMRRWLPEGHPVWLVIEAVRLLDTSVLHARRRTGGAGAAGYDPDMLVRGPDLGVCERDHVVAADRAIIASFCASLRLMRKAGDKNLHPVNYLGDLKIDKCNQKTHLFYRLARRMKEIIDKNSDIAIGVVMNGTKNTPKDYSGKVGIPAFNPISKHYILRFQTSNNLAINENSTIAPEKIAFSLYEKITDKDYFLPSNSDSRSKIKPLWLVDKEGNACGMLEDTENVKQLISSDGEMLRSAHLSYFSFTKPSTGYELLVQALRLSSQHHFPYIFVALNEMDFSALSPLITELPYELSTAIAFGTSNSMHLNLQINTAEI